MVGLYVLTVSNVGSSVQNRIEVFALYDSVHGPIQYAGRAERLGDRLIDVTADYYYFGYDYHSVTDRAYERKVDL